MYKEAIIPTLDRNGSLVIPHAYHFDTIVQERTGRPKKKRIESMPHDKVYKASSNCGQHVTIRGNAQIVEYVELQILCLHVM